MLQIKDHGHKYKTMFGTPLNILQAIDKVYGEDQ